LAGKLILEMEKISKEQFGEKCTSYLNIGKKIRYKVGISVLINQK